MMFVVRHLKTGKYSSKGGWVDDLQDAHVWGRKQSASYYTAYTDYDRNSPTYYQRIKEGEVVEVHVVLGPDPSKPLPVKPPKKGSTKVQTTVSAEPDEPPDYWKELFQPKDDADITP
jgi:hypothetical protein